MIQNTKAQQSAILALMCAGKPIVHLATGARALDDEPVVRTGRERAMLVPEPELYRAQSPIMGIVPFAEQFASAYLAEFTGDQPIMPVYEDEGDWAAEAPIARKKGQEWRDELELQESGDIVGYWGEGI